MSDEYEYQIADNDRTIQVRPKQEGRSYAWRHYMTCDSKEQAIRVLNMLLYPEVDGMVRE